jgi:hypothetical protein
MGFLKKISDETLALVRFLGMENIFDLPICEKSKRPE